MGLGCTPTRACSDQARPAGFRPNPTRNNTTGSSASGIATERIQGHRVIFPAPLNMGVPFALRAAMSKLAQRELTTLPGCHRASAGLPHGRHTHLQISSFSSATVALGILCLWQSDPATLSNAGTQTGQQAGHNHVCLTLQARTALASITPSCTQVVGPLHVHQKTSDGFPGSTFFPQENFDPNVSLACTRSPSTNMYTTTNVHLSLALFKNLIGLPRSCNTSPSRERRPHASATESSSPRLNTGGTMLITTRQTL